MVVIGILVTILVPVISQVGMGYMERVKCAANLKAVGQAGLAWAAEHDNNLVPLRMDPVGEPDGFWYDHLNEFFGRRPGRAGRLNENGVLVDPPEYVCPTVERRYLINRICGWNGHGEKGAMPWYLTMGEGFANNKRIELPGGLAKTAWFACPQEIGDGYFFPEYYNTGNGNFIGFPHSNTANVVFMDGHVENITNPDFQQNPELLRQQQWVNFFGKEP